MFYLLQNQNDSDFYDVATKNKNGTYRLWGQVPCDFLSAADIHLWESGSNDNYPKILRVRASEEKLGKEIDTSDGMSLDDAIRVIGYRDKRIIELQTKNEEYKTALLQAHREEKIR